MLSKFRVGLAFVVLASAAGIATPASAQAFDPDLSRGTRYLNPRYSDDLPTDLGSVSIDSSRRALRALMRDWKDDDRLIRNKRYLVCGMTLAKGVLSSAFFASLNQYNLGMAIFFSQFDLYFPPGRAKPARVLGKSLRWMMKWARLTAGERRALDRLLERDEYVLDRTDKIRLAIDTQWFIVRVANRLYEERVEYHEDRTEGFWGFFRWEEEKCAAYTTRHERNERLRKAARSILRAYTLLERELEY